MWVFNASGLNLTLSVLLLNSVQSQVKANMSSFLCFCFIKSTKTRNSAKREFYIFGHSEALNHNLTTQSFTDQLRLKNPQRGQLYFSHEFNNPFGSSKLVSPGSPTHLFSSQAVPVYSQGDWIQNSQIQTPSAKDSAKQGKCIQITSGSDVNCKKA